MQRRQALRSILSLPAVAALPAAGQEKQPLDKTAPAAGEKLPPEIKPSAVEEAPKLALTAADAACGSEARFFSPREYATLEKLADVLVPSFQGRPGAREARCAEFLDFLIGTSPAPRRELYRAGLNRLDSDARQRYSKPFAELSASEAEPLLAELRQPAPADSNPRFLASAKEDILRATVNSREWARSSPTRRGAGALGTYWFPIE